MNNRKQRLFLAVTALLLCGCVGNPELRNATDTTAKTLLLNEQVSIPAGKGRITFQGGKIVTGHARLEAYYQLLSDRVSPQAQVIPPERFAITRVSQLRSGDDLIEMPVNPGMLSRGCSEHFYYTTRLRLHSESQPDIRELVCREAFRDCEAGRYPTAELIESVSGGTLRLE